MAHTESEKLVIKWWTRDTAVVESIRRRFCIPAYTTLNGMTPVEIKPEDMADFEWCWKHNLFSVLPLKWRKNGGVYIFLSRK